VTAMSLYPVSERARDIYERAVRFVDTNVRPGQIEYAGELERAVDPWKVPAVIEDLKAKAREEGLWNLFLPDSEHGAGLTNLEYAPIAELTGHVPIAAEAFNCSAPDTGNMEPLHLYGSDEHKTRWLLPLLRGEIRSGFMMTEPEVASSDATNIRTEIRRDGDDYVINGHKWWITNAGDPRCQFFIVMGLTDPGADPYRRQSMIIVPKGTPGLRIERMLKTFGFDDAPTGHAQVVLDNVRVPANNVILGEGRGFEIAQGRLGPGRIHHCMRLIGAAEEALTLMCRRLSTRIAFGTPLTAQSVWVERIANARIEIDQVRLQRATCCEPGASLQFKSQRSRGLSLGRLAHRDEVANAVTFLAVSPVHPCSSQCSTNSSAAASCRSPNCWPSSSNHAAVSTPPTMPTT
jgi:acyl-CoA dehydrogenase